MFDALATIASQVLGIASKVLDITYPDPEVRRERLIQKANDKINSLRKKIHELEKKIDSY